ncbi:MAG: xanthine dehydrogenase family protein molybdopterin-binding subunit [Deltaproteobacteria bacterium]|nr:xanthine dehydrogenase family protein molybdopterin-binding subunit [Deltaproteobacteria bacterium]
MSYIGARVKRTEDLRLLRGVGRFVGDIRRVGMNHAAILRSPCAHARILRIDTEAATKLAGVVGVVTFADMAEVKPIPMRTGKVEGMERSLQYPLAGNKVRYVGEPVAVVVAENRYLAEDALELIDVQYELLDAVTDPWEAMQPGTPILHESVPDNIAAHFVVDVGDVDRAMAEADEIIEEEFSVQRHAAVPLETRGLVAEFDEGRGVLSVWGPTKVIHTNRMILSELLDMPESCIHLIEPDVGGGFGARGEFYPEDFAIPFVAKHLKQPVCWIEDRSENLKATNHSREQGHYLKVAVKRDGTILGVEDRLYFNMGAYTRTHGAVPAISGSAMLRGPYKIANYRADVFCILTNKTPAGTYRSPGRYEAAFVRERMIDMVVHRLGLDPADVRRRNFIQPHEMPYDCGPHKYHDVVYDSGNYPGLLEKALTKIDYPELKASSGKARREGRAVGVGIACFVETSGVGPWEYARVEVDPTGKVVVYAGCASLGQGVETVLSQIAADALNVRPEEIMVVHGDTNLVPFGMGSNASRTTVMAGSAVFRAALKVKEKLFQLAAGAFEIGPGDLQLVDGRVAVRGAPDRSMTFAQLARLAAPHSALKGGIQPGISETDFFAAPRRTFPYGVHVAQVEVDRETGLVQILKYLVSEDIGRAVNPMLVEGQMVGGFAQGLGGALLEEFAFNSDGQPLATSFMDYLLPTAMEVPHVELLSVEECLSPSNPLGVKGAGEGGIVAVGGALANAVSDALGVEVTRLPMKPEYVRDLARQGAQKP